MEKKYKVLESIFFGEKVVVRDNLSIEEARGWEKHDGDIYTERYILPQEVPSDLIYDYNHRVV